MRQERAIEVNRNHLDHLKTIQVRTNVVEFVRTLVPAVQFSRYGDFLKDRIWPWLKHCCRS